MKGCFLLQRNFAYIGHYLAIQLRERYGVEDFCGYVYVRQSHEFLTRQQDIRYSSLLLDQEIHSRYLQEKLDLDYLRMLERDYGMPNLWPFVSIDRVMMCNQLVREYPHDTPKYTYEEMLRIVQVKAKAIIEFLDREKPDFAFYSVIGGTGSMLLYHIAKKKGIRNFVVHPTSIRDTYVLSEEYNRLTFVEERFKRYRREGAPADSSARAQTFLREFRGKPYPHYDVADPKKQPVSRSRQLNFLLPGRLARNLKLLAASFKKHFTQNDRYDYDYIGPWNYLKDAIRRKARNLVGVNDLYDDFDPDKPFAFFPLHFEPEISLLLLAPFFTDQISVIKLVAKSLPVGYTLYVKEHPTMVPYRPRSYYLQLKKIPNVKLLNPAIPSFDIIPPAKLIATITSSAGWEGCFFKKPVVTFGDIFYNQLSFVKKCRTPEDLPSIVKAQIEDFQFDEQELLALITALFDEAAELNLQYLWQREHDFEKKRKGLQPLADLLAKKLNLNPSAIEKISS